MAKIHQNDEEYGHMEQVDVAGGPGAHMPCRSTPLGHRPMPPWHRPRHKSMGAAIEPITSLHSNRFDQSLMRNKKRRRIRRESR